MSMHAPGALVCSVQPQYMYTKYTYITKHTLGFRFLCHCCWVCGAVWFLKTQVFRVGLRCDELGLRSRGVGLVCHNPVGSTEIGSE